MRNRMLAKWMSIIIASASFLAVVMPAYAEDQTNTTEDAQISESAKGDAGMKMDGQQPPQMPDGDSFQMNKEQPPEKPDGDFQLPPDGDFQPPGDMEGSGIPERPDDMGGTGGMEKPDGEMGIVPDGAPGGMTQGVESYDAVTSYSEDTETDGETYASAGTDENAVLVDSGATVKISNASISRDSEESTGGDTSSFYGVGAAVLTTDGTVYVEGSSIATDAAGGAGVFAYGNGTAYVSDTTISTEKATSGGIHVAGGGTLYAYNTEAVTQGESSAVIRSDRGGGTMVVDGGAYTSNGVGSPAVYSTADITIHDADLTANGSEAICIEGLNGIRLFDCDLTGNMADLDQNDCTWNVILYQSMSGDSEIGNSTFTMQGGTLRANNGGMFYTTNTESTFLLSGVEITYAEDNDFFLKCTGNVNERGWGQTGSNGADCSFTAIGQEMKGDIVWDSISSLDFYMMDGSSLEGAFVQDESCAGEGGSGYANLSISSDSVWIVTGDSTLDTLYAEGSVVDKEGKTVSIVNADGTVYVEGDSDFTVTVTGYETTADFSAAGSCDDWSNYDVEM